MTGEQYRRRYTDISGELNVLAGTGDTTLVTVRDALHTLYIQEIFFFVTTDAAQSMSFEDSNGTPKIISAIPINPGVSTPWRFYPGGEEGMALTEGKNFLMNVSAAGLAGRLKWVGYQKRTAVGVP